MSSDGLDAVSAGPHDGTNVIALTSAQEEGANFSGQPSSGRMATNGEHRPDRERTVALLEEIASGRRGEALRAQVAAWNREATWEQVEEAFQEACARATRLCTGQTMGEVYTWLRTTTHREVGDMRERVKHEIVVDTSNAALESTDASLAAPDEVLIEREDRAEVNRLTLALLDRLAERERRIAVLHSHGLARNEIAQHMGITPRIVKRSVEEILTTGRDQLVRLVGFGCADGHEYVSRYAFGLAGVREARRAQTHLMTCARCGAMYERLDMWRDRVAALLPVPPVVESHAHLAERVIHAGADALSSGPSPATASPTGLRRHLASVAGHVREQATAAYYRTVDPTPLAGVRPGAVAAAVAGCLAIGGGATYCVQQGADPFTTLAGLGAPEHHAPEKPKPRHKRARVAQATPPPVVTPTVTTPTQTVQQTTTPAPTTTTTAQPPPAPEDQFEPTSAGASQTATQASTSNPKQPAPAPSDGPSEFGGP
ncbi:MAG TPA: sigma-70 family RNA polymerase sigma factor [Solirubrobacteraceae bacterium]|nr:sigma-70 family RNA polymerase sigma factor [Solirubrobacteraceae bacterium]